MKYKTTTYTSTLPSVVMEEITEYAKKTNTTKNKIIEEAVVSFLNQEKRKKYEEGFKRVASDSEMKNIAEEGNSDFSKQLKKY